MLTLSFLQPMHTRPPPPPTPSPPPLTKDDVAAIVKDALNHHLTPPFEKILKKAIERTRLEERVESLEKETTRLQQERQEEKKRVEEERRRGELAVANLDITGRRLYSWEMYKSGLDGGRRLPANSARSVSG